MMTVKVFFMDKLFCIHTDINRMPLFPLIYNSIIIYECLSLLESFWQSRETLPFPPLLSPQINPIYPYPDHKVNPKQPTPLAPVPPLLPAPQRITQNPFPRNKRGDSLDYQYISTIYLWLLWTRHRRRRHSSISGNNNLSWQNSSGNNTNTSRQIC